MIWALMQYTLPVLLAAFGGLMTDLAGTLNIALESLILAGAFTAFLVSVYSQSVLLGFLAAALVGALLAAGVFAAALKTRANIFVTGLGLNLMVPGLIATISSVIFGTRGVLRSAQFPPQPNLLGAPLPMAVSFLLVLVLWYILALTPLGLRVRALGYHPHVAQIRGISPFRTRITAFAVSGFACGAAGALLTFGLRSYVPNVSAGRGWIALAAIYLGRRSPGGVVAAALLFGGAELASNAAQGRFDLPSSLFMAGPYAAAVIALVLQGYLFWRREKRR